MPIKIKPSQDFADIINGKERLFIAGKYYSVPENKAKEYSKDNKALVRVEWQEGDITCSTYKKL